MKIRREVGIVRPGAMSDGALVRESRAHFDILCERFPDSGWTEFRVGGDGRLVVAVEDAERIGYGPAVPQRD